jgi:FMN phosphatase YigB (HAD superfamily)
MIKDKLILCDCDGVLVDWVYGFTKWMKQHGYEIQVEGEYDIAKTFGITKAEGKRLVRHFNESAAMGWLPSLRDAVKYVRKLHEEHGYVFHCITSLSLDEHAGKLRKKNLEALFGKTVFEKVTCLDTGADKDEALEEYRDTGCYWIEDKVENAELGDELGLESILIEHGFNKDYENENIQKVQTWKEIYEMIV